MHGLSNALAPGDVLLEVSLRHEILHVHLALVLWQDDAAVHLLQLHVGHVLARVVLDASDLEEILVARFVCALTVVLGILLSEAHLCS